MHWPEELTEPCSWYCQVATSGGCQQEPTEVLHGTGAGRAAAVAEAVRNPARAWLDAVGAAEADPVAKNTAVSAAMTPPEIRTLRISHLRFTSSRRVVNGRWLERNEGSA